MKLKMIALAAATMLSGVSAMAAIAPGSTGNGELFLSVFDSTAKVSYTMDLGVRMDTFFTTAQGDAGASFGWALNDANFSTFLTGSGVDASNLRWAVMAGDSTGSPVLAGVNGQRLFTTVRSGATATQIASPTNQNLTNGVGTLNTFITAVNATGTHSIAGDVASRSDYTTNGSSVNAASDSGISYFGEAGGTGPTFNGNFTTLFLDSAVGQSAAFYQMTHSSASGVAKVTLDQFDNSKYQGMFTLQSGANGYSLSYALTAVAAVPEPSSYALLLAGLGAVGFMARRRSAAR